MSLMISVAAKADELKQGQDYARVVPPQPAGGDGKVEVLELFWYGCSHCYQFEPYIKDWLKRKPDYVEYVRLPAIFGSPAWRLHATAFYTAQVLGVGEKIHEPLFDAIHKHKRRLKTEDQLMEFFVEHGVSEEDFKKTFKSFAVQAKVRRAADLTRRYGAEGVPTMIVNGKYRVDGPMAKNYGNLLKIVDQLAEQEVSRK
jgi:thiol:disulfide interchange protein DsbA